MSESAGHRVAAGQHPQQHHQLRRTRIASQATKSEFAFFVQDNWQVHPRLTLDLGLRLDHDSLSSQAANVAPRMGFVFAPTRDGRTAIRGGVGSSTTRSRSTSPCSPSFRRRSLPIMLRTVRRSIAGPATYDARARLARVARSLQPGMDPSTGSRTGPRTRARIGYENRQGYRDFYVNPVVTPDGDCPTPTPQQRQQSYREFLAMLRWQANRAVVGERQLMSILARTET